MAGDLLVTLPPESAAANHVMNPETVSFHGWNNTLRLANESVELMVTTDVGPRILVYKTHRGDNVLKIFHEQLGSSEEEEWCIRGGHRLWLAPEDVVLSYHLDNSPVKWRKDSFTGEIQIESLQERSHAIRKTLGILLDPSSSRVTLRHTLTNESDLPITLSAWALTVMQPGGLEIIPQPALGEHPHDLHPNRGMVLWPYTDLSDPRYTFGRKFWMLRQSSSYPPTKIGLAHREKWAAYLLNDSLFIKTFDYEPGAQYPDGGCNFETFSNSDMLEVESLGPLVKLGPHQKTTHIENWYLFPLVEELQIESEESLEEWIAPFLAKTHLE